MQHENIAGIEDETTTFNQTSNKTPSQYVDELDANTCRCGEIYEK